MNRRMWLRALVAIPGVAMLARAITKTAPTQAQSTTAIEDSECFMSWRCTVPSDKREQTEEFLDILTANGASVYRDPLTGSRLFPHVASGTSGPSSGLTFCLTNGLTTESYIDATLGRLTPAMLEQAVSYCHKRLKGSGFKFYNLPNPDGDQQ